LYFFLLDLYHKRSPTKIGRGVGIPKLE